MEPDSLGVIAVSSVYLAIGGAFMFSRLPQGLKIVLVLGLGFRVLGAVTRFQVLMASYGGRGDAPHYFARSVQNAAMAAEGNLSFLYDPVHWRTGAWWGTEFVEFPGTLFVALFGPDMLAVFLGFAFLAFAGLAGFLVGFRRAAGRGSLVGYGLLLFCYPSLWFWPSSLGKEALLLCGMGLAVMGFVGKDRHPQLGLLVLGLFLVFAVRPQVAAILALCFALSHWVGRQQRWTGRTMVQLAGLIVIALGALYYASRVVGLDTYQISEFDQFIEDTGSRDVTGGTSVAPVEVGPSGLPMAMINILFRPFPWEATNAFVFISALEIWVLWTLVVLRRRHVIEALHAWRSEPLVSLSLFFVVIYSTALGLMLVNLGIIARQRIFLFPFIMILLFIRDPRPIRAGPPVLSYIPGRARATMNRV